MGQLVEVDNMLFKLKDTRRWWKSLEGLKACPNDSKCSSLIHLSYCYMYFMFLDVERKWNPCEWKLWKKICHLSSTCAYIFEFFVVDIVDGAIYFLYKLLGNHWELTKAWDVEGTFIYFNWKDLVLGMFTNLCY
jgi:hypothetical protein